MPFGFPSGATLKDWICEAENPGDRVGRELQTKLNLDPGEIRHFARTLRQSHINSIDAFLFRRPEFNAIGKFAIAAHISQLEDASRLDSAADNEHWYRLIWNRMVADTVAARDIRRNRIRFISFNYDRSLERFLFGVIKHTYGVPDGEAYELMRSLGIVHVYGQVGDFSYEGNRDQARVYDPELTPNALRIAAAGIRLIPEERGRDERFDLARKWLDMAERVCFLGFGFDATNCENLGFYDVMDWQTEHRKPLPRIFASTYGFTKDETEQARKRACRSYPWVFHAGDNVMTLRELGVLSD